MTAPNANRPPERRRNRLWKTVGLTVGIGTVALGIGAALWARNFIRNDLAPLLSDRLTESLERPVSIGDVEQVTLQSIQVGPSSIGATSEDPTAISAESVTVRFNLLAALFSRKLDLDLTVRDGEGYLEQDSEKGWLVFEIPEREEKPEPFFEVRVDQIHVRDIQVTAVPYFEESASVDPIVLDTVNGLVDIDPLEIQGEKAQRIRFDMDINPATGGNITVMGEIQPLIPEDTVATGDEVEIKRATNLVIRGQRAALPDVLNFTLATVGLQFLPVVSEAGQVSANLELNFYPEKPTDFSGTVTIDDGTLQVASLKQPLTDVEAELQLKESTIFLDQATADLGELAAQVEGAVHLRQGYDLKVMLDEVTVEKVQNTFDLTLPVTMTGTFASEATVTGKLAEPRVEGVVTATEPVTVDKLAFETVETEFSLQWPQRRLVFEDMQAVLTAGGQLAGQGAIDFTDTPTDILFQVEGQNLPADAIATIYNLKVPITLGTVAAQATIAGSPGDLETTILWQAPKAQYPGRGTLVYDRSGLSFRDTILAIGGGTVQGAGTLAKGRWQATLNATGVALNQFVKTLSGRLSGDFQLAGNTQNFSLATIEGRGNFQIQQLASGTLTGTATVNDGRWGSNLTASGIQLNQLAQTLRGAASGQFQLAGVTDDFSLSAIQAEGNLTLSDGLAALSTQLANFDQPLTSTLAWDGRQILIEQARSEQLQASGVVIPEINGYRVAGIERFNLDLVAQNYPLATAPLPTPAAVNLGGFATFAGTLTGNPSAPNLTGSLRLNEFAVNQLAFEPVLTGTINYAQGDLALAVAGDRDQIEIDYANPRDFSFQVNWQDAYARGTTTGDVLNATLGNFPLAVLQFPAQGVGPVGQLRGTISSPDLAINLANRTLIGSIAIDQFGIGYVGVEQITGQVRYANNLATLVDGKVLFEDSFYRVNGRLNLSNDFAYVANIQTDQGNIQDLLTALSIFEFSDLARGLKPPTWVENPVGADEIPTVLATQSTGNPESSLLTQLRRLAEIQAIQDRDEQQAEQAPFPPLRELDGPFAGTINLSGSRSAGVNADFNLSGYDWRWGDEYAADRVIARGEYGDGRLVLEPLRFESTLPVAAAPVTETETALDPEPEEASIELAGQFFLANPDDTGSNLQLVVKNIAIDRVRDILNLPLSMDGRLNGTATLSGTIGDPQVRGIARLVNASINRQPIESGQAQFLYQNARLSLLSTLQAQDNPEPLQLSAQIPYAFGFMTIQPASDQILLDINVKDEGLALLNILNRQVTWESGEGTVALSVRGTLSNPVVEGFATLQDTTLRARVLPEPITNLNGTARFTGDRIIVDQLTGQFSDGQLAAAGTFPILFPIISGAELSALGSPSPEGPDSESPESPSSAPVTEAVTAANSPLTVSLDNIALNLKGLYDGQVNGRVVVGGSLLLGGPQLGGRIELSQGQIFLPETTAGAGATAADAMPVASNDGSSGLSITPRFQNLNLALGRSVQIIQGNLLNFFADGSLQLNGPMTVSGIQPEGTIRLITGRVNLFTTSFRLAGSDNTATFVPELGITDPILDVDLRTSVAEVTRSGPITATTFATSEVADTSIDPFRTATGSLQTIRIRASVNGPTSQIFNNLELSSSPPRSQNEIIGLIGGSFITALESGSSGDLSGVVNLFGGALLNRIQDFITSTLNLSEFRLFPVTSASRYSTRENTGSTLDIGAEVGFDISDSFTISLLKILTDSTPTEFNLRYRLSDQFTIRTTTNLDDVNRVLLEFETRF